MQKSPKGQFPTCLLVLFFCTSLVHAAAVNTSPAFFNKSIRPLTADYCLTCHSTEKQKGELDLERFTSLTEVKKHPKIWQNVIDQLEHDEMPPKDKPQPSSEQRRLFLAWLNSVL